MTIAELPVRRRHPPPPGPPDRVTDYARSVVDGETLVGHKVRLACEKHLADLESASERGLRWDPAKAERHLDFYPAFLVHIEGPKAGQPIVLEPWQCFVLGSVFGWERWDDERQTWRRRYRRAFVEVAKKNGKSIIAGGLGLFLAFFDREAGAQVVAAATKRDQAKLVWGAAKLMAEKSAHLKKRIGIRVLSLFDPTTGSRFWPIGKDTGTEDGINPSAGIIDEVHRHDDRSLIDLLTNSFGARANPLLWMITTAGSTGQSVWAEEHDYAVRVLEGLIEDESLFAYIANLDEGDDPFDEAVWVKANPNLGVSIFRDEMRDRAREAQAKPGARNDFLRLRLNIRTQSVQRWMPPELWRANGTPPEPMAGRIAYGGLDLGSRDDLSALILLIPSDDGWLDVHCRFWCPQAGIQERSRKDRVPYDRWAADGLITPTPGDVTDYDVLRRDMGLLANPEDDADWADIWEVAFDPHDATQLVSQLQSDGFRMVRLIQSTTEMDPTVTEVERLLATGKVRHGNHPVLSWMVDNVDMVQDASGRRKPDKLHARDRIDGVPALLMALKRWMVHAGSEVTWTAA